tara:strand:+ start:21574 stop:23010 length:1437 start_codon:yes stop_codon:yes gene_type:complete
MKEHKITPLILCGGTGSRLWPLSRASYPKQYLEIRPKEGISFLQETILRIKNLKNIEDPIIVCNEEHRFIVAEQIRQLGIQAKAILLEPIGRNTAPAIAAATIKAFNLDKESILLALPADHIIQEKNTFRKVINKALSFVIDGKIVTFGITPNRAETGYGYIESSNPLRVKDLNGEKITKFIEKPDKKNAEKFITDKKFSWNSGIFFFKAEVLLYELSIMCPDIYKFCEKALMKKFFDLEFQRLDKELFSLCEEISFDKAVMEKTSLGVVLPLDAGWSDIGNWQSMWEVSDKDEYENVILGKVISKEVKSSYLRSENKLIVGLGLENLIVVETNDAILVANKNKAQNVKNIVELLKNIGEPEATKHKTIFRPWGNYTSIAEGINWQVKKIIVKPYASLSLQLHNHRSEHWVIVDGTALVEIDNKEQIINQNESIYIPLGSKHRLSNRGKKDLVLIEVQSGNYLGEDDIVRFKDNYGRL